MDVRSLLHIIGFKVDQGDINKAEAMIEGVTGKIAMIGAGLTAAFTAPLAFIAKKIGETITQFEQWDVSFETMLGDPKKGKQVVKDVMDFVARTPFELTNIMPATKQLLAFGVESDSLISTLTDLGNVASGLGVPITRIIHNFGQVRTMGKLMGREIRDFQTSGVPVLEYVADVMGVNKNRVQELASQGKVSFEVMREAFRRMAGEGGRFANLMEKQSKTLGGRWSNFKDRITISMKVFESEWMPLLKGAMKFINEAFDKLVSKLDPAMIRFITSLGAILALIGPILLAISAFFATGTAIVGMLATLKLALGILGVGIAAVMIKFTLAIAAVGAVIAIVALLVEDLWSYAKGQDSLFGTFFGPWEELKPKVLGIINSVMRVLRTFWNLLSSFFSGILKIIKGFWEGDIDLFFDGVFETISNFFGMLVFFVWEIVIRFWGRLRSWAWSKILGFIEQLMRRALALTVGTFEKLLATAMKYYEKIKGMFSFLGIGGGGTLATPNLSPAAFGAASTTSTNINMVNNSTIQVPEGTTQYQKDFLKQANKKLADQMFGAKLSELSSNIGRNGG